MSVTKICALFNYSRQNYYKRRKYEDKEESTKAQVKQLVLNVRKKLPRLGVRKLHYLISKDAQSLGIKCGRDKLFSYLGEMNLLVKSKRRYVRTTFSNHWMKKYPNIFANMELYRPEQAWVGDITYLDTDEGNCYLSLITDAYSRKIVGYNVSDNMLAESSVKALKMAIKGRMYPTANIIHHSDRGSQYCSREYVETATNANIAMSMTETSSPYDNALAERMNKTMKEEFNLNIKLKTKQQVFDVVAESIKLYNSFRPHLALDFYTPNDIHKNPTLNKKIDN